MATPVAAQPQDAAAPFVALRALDQRLAGVAERLAIANLALCADRQFRPGFSLHDLSQYDAGLRPAAIRAFGLDNGPGIFTLSAAGPAENGGLRLGDVLTAIDGAPLANAEALAPRGGYERMERIHGVIEGAFADGQATLSIRRGGVELSLTIVGVEGCASRFEIIPGRNLNARADGRYVQVTVALAQYAADEQELAAVVAHELAHNILRHRARLDAAGIQRGFFGNFGRNARLVRETELEADRLAPYLLERAGYDPDAMIRFWRRFGNRGFNIFGSPTHGGWGRRAEAIQGEIVRIRQARAAGQVPAPDFVSLPLAPAS